MANKIICSLCDKPSVWIGYCLYHYNKNYRELNRVKLLANGKEYYQNHKEKWKIHGKQYYEANKEHITKRNKNYVESHKDKIKEYNKKWREINKESQFIKRKEYREKNKEVLKLRRQDYYKNNKIQCNERSREYFEKNREQVNTRTNEWRRKNRDKVVQYDKRHLEKIGSNINIFDEHKYKWQLYLWREVVKETGKECVICGNNEDLNAHHLFYKRFYPKLSLNTSNGITLCKQHHLETHGQKLVSYVAQ